MKLKWPEEAFLVTAEDMQKVGNGLSKDGPCCLYGYVNVFISGDPRPYSSKDSTGERAIRMKLKKAIEKAITQLQGTAPLSSGWSTIVTFNDSPDVPLALVARVWNRAMAILGYVVGNPEAKLRRAA